MAYVVSKNEDDLTEFEVMEYVHENVAPYKKLRGGVEFISSIPQTIDGQVCRAELLERRRKNKSRIVTQRRSLLPWNENKRLSVKRLSLSPNFKTLTGGHSTITEETPRKNVIRSQRKNASKQRKMTYNK